MLIDKRIEKLAHGLVDFSCDVQKGENVLIEATGTDYQSSFHLPESAEGLLAKSV